MQETSFVLRIPLKYAPQANYPPSQWKEKGTTIYWVSDMYQANTTEGYIINGHTLTLLETEIILQLY